MKECMRQVVIADIWQGTILKELQKANLDFSIIHDSILIKETDSDKLEAIFENIRETMGLTYDQNR